MQLQEPDDLTLPNLDKGSPILKLCYLNGDNNSLLGYYKEVFRFSFNQLFNKNSTQTLAVSEKTVSNKHLGSEIAKS